MLNELYQLSRNLQKCGIVFGTPHQDVKEPGKSEGFVIGIDQNGAPKSAEHINAEHMHRLWTLRKGQHDSFPYIKLKKPIFDVKFDDPIYEKLKSKKTKSKEKAAILVQATQNYDLSKKQGLSLKKWIQSQIAKVEGQDQKLSALVDLVKRMPKDEKSSEDFLKNLFTLLVGNLNEQTVDLIKTVLVGDKKEKERKIVCGASLFLDVSDWEKYLCRVANPEMGLLVNKYLPKASAGSKKDSISAFGGKGLHNGPYPEPNLQLFKAYLFSMNENIPCHNRYGKIGSAIFPVSLEEVQAMHGAIKWCVAEERKGKTWQGVPNIKRKKDLVIAYLEEKPGAEIKLASIFTTFDVSEETTSEAIYENQAMNVCNALKGETGLKNESKINILVITKVDEGRAQIVLSTSYTIENITSSLEKWHVAAKNRPHFSVLLPGKKGEKAQVMEPFCPSPAEVMKCLQNQWIRKGLDRRDVPGVALRHVYDLFFGEGCISQETAQMFLNIVLQRLSPLFVGITGVEHAGDVTKYSTEARKTVLTGVSVLAIALHKAGIKKEDYMKNAAFSIGRMFALADKLHEQYCRHVRKNKFPAQLIGNALIYAALDNPMNGLARLSERLPIYQAWATTAQGDDVGLAKWVLGQLGQISASLENATIPTQVDDIVKAQMLLGYLAHVKNEG